MLIACHLLLILIELLARYVHAAGAVVGLHLIALIEADSVRFTEV